MGFEVRVGRLLQRLDARRRSRRICEEGDVGTVGSGRVDLHPLEARLRPRHATVQKARRGNGDGYEGWLRRHFASPPRRRSKTSPPKVWI